MTNRVDMKLEPIITSLIETDLYKLNMWQVFLHQFNKDKVVWAFKCRKPGVKFTPEMVAEIRKQIDHYCMLRFTEDELQYLQKNHIHDQVYNSSYLLKMYLMYIYKCNMLFHLQRH